MAKETGDISAKPPSGTSTHGILAQLAISLVFVYYSYSGWNAAVYVAEEIEEPRKTLPIALVFGTLAVTVLFFALNCLYIYATPLEEMKGVIRVGSLAAVNLFGPRTAGFFSAAMAASLLATVNAMCMIGPRVYYAMAKDRAFFASAAKIHPRWKSPWVAVIYQGGCCCLLILTGTFKSLVLYIGFTLWLFSALSVMALLKFRKKTRLGADAMGQLCLSAAAGALRRGQSLDLCVFCGRQRAGSVVEFVDHFGGRAGLPVLHSEKGRFLNNCWLKAGRFVYD